MKGQEQYDIAEEFAAEARKVLGQKEGKDTAVWAEELIDGPGC